MLIPAAALPVFIPASPKSNGFFVVDAKEGASDE
jgi:hypothetical protein